MKILITGAEGFLGKKLFSTLNNKNNILGIARSSQREGVSNLNLMDSKILNETISKFNPEAIIHTASLVDIEKCEAEQDLAYAINVICTENIVNICKKNNIKLIYISTDYVFSGNNPEYTRESEKDPVNYYGLTKSLAEERVKESLKDFAIIRPTILYGFNDSKDKKNFVSNVITKLKSGERLFLDNKRTKYPLLIEDLTRAIEKILSEGLNGIFHLSGQEAITKYDFGVKIARAFSLSEEKIFGRNSNEPFRPEKVNFKKSDNIIDVLNIEQGLSLIKEQIQKYGNS